jgi:hypothetical protein
MTKLRTPDASRAAEVRDEGRSTLERTTGAGQWSPFAASNRGEGILTRALKKTL